jgi:DNA invertase Pin-like site-specific DNA recombinase
MSTRRQLAATPASLVDTKRCAIYTRKSTTIGLEQEFNSLDAQREACEQYIRSQAALGWQLVLEEYSDGGYSGANIQRPAFQRLMQDVEARRIDIVVVHRVDRLSRSLLDFAKLMDRFNRAGVAFVSVTQNFSTADAMGRLTLNVLMSFAEFERAMIGERTRDKMSAARRKGRWTGGPAPLGYDVVDRKLVVNETEAALVRRIFALYLDLRSAVAVARALNAESQTTKHHVSTKGNNHGARAWDRQAVLHILRNPIAAGLMSCHDEVHEGQHQAIIDQVTYRRVQSMLDERSGERTHWGRNPGYILTGIIRCALCGQAYTPASTRRGSREYRYYRCSTRDKRGHDACAGGPLPARAIEDFVVARVRDALADGTLAADVTRAVKDRLADQRASLVTERRELPSKIAALSSEGKRLVEAVSNVKGAGQRLLDAKLQEVGEQLGRLEARLREVEHRLSLLDGCEFEAEWVSQCLADFNLVWDTLSSENRGRLVRAVIERVEVDEPKGDVRTFIANLGSATEVIASAAGAST